MATAARDGKLEVRPLTPRSRGAPAVEGYARTGGKRVHDVRTHGHRGDVPQGRLPARPRRDEGPVARLDATRHDARRRADDAMKATPKTGALTVRPLAPARADDVKTITRGTWGSQCWDLHPRLTASKQRALGLAGKPTGAVEAKRREIVAKLARRRSNAPMLVAYVDGEPAGFVSVGPRSDYARVTNSKATPPVDEVPAWVIPCLTVRRGYRGRGVGVALLRAAVTYAGERGAPAIEGYPRAGDARVHDDFAYIGTEALFRKAGFRRIRGVMKELPRGWTPRVTMRATCAPRSATSSTSRRRSAAAR